MADHRMNRQNFIPTEVIKMDVIQIIIWTIIMAVIIYLAIRCYRKER